MSLGPGKYDDQLGLALTLAGATEGALLVIKPLTGDSGFSCRCSPGNFVTVAKALRSIADEIERDYKEIVTSGET